MVLYSGCTFESPEELKKEKEKKAKPIRIGIFQGEAQALVFFKSFPGNFDVLPGMKIPYWTPLSFTSLLSSELETVYICMTPFKWKNSSYEPYYLIFTPEFCTDALFSQRDADLIWGFLWLWRMRFFSPYSSILKEFMR